MAGAELGLIISINNAAVREGQNHIKAAPNAQIGSVGLNTSGGYGAAHYFVKSKPDWDRRPDSEVLAAAGGTASVHPKLPPVIGITSEYVFGVKDSAKPTPAEDDATLKVTTDIPAGFDLLPIDARQVPILIDPAIWQVLDHSTVTLDNWPRNFIDRTLSWKAYQHKATLKVLIYWTLTQTADSGGARARTVNRYKVFEPRVYFDDICQAIISREDCRRQDADSVWTSLQEHMPPWRLDA